MQTCRRGENRGLQLNLFLPEQAESPLCGVLVGGGHVASTGVQGQEGREALPSLGTRCRQLPSVRANCHRACPRWPGRG